MPGPSLLSSMTQNSSAAKATLASSPFASFTSPAASQSATPQPQYSAFQAPQPPAADPFASLGMPSSSSPAPKVAAAPPPKPTVSGGDDDEWSFASSLPSEAPSRPKEHRATISSGDVRIDLLATRASGTSSAMNVVFAFSNTTAQPISELHFQLAVTKVDALTH